MAVVCFSCLPIFFAGQAIRRWEGILFLLFFALYLADLILEELHDTPVLTLQNAAPLATLTIDISVWRQWVKSRTER